MSLSSEFKDEATDSINESIWSVEFPHIIQMTNAFD